MGVAPSPFTHSPFTLSAPHSAQSRQTMKDKKTNPSQIIEPGAFGAVYHQRFAVDYDYPVHFTHDLFARDNPVFVDALSRKEPNKRHRFLAFIDADVAASWPALAHDICAYVEHHGERLQLLAHPETIVGGEQVKHDPELVTRLQRRLLDLGVDRHSYVVAIGGGAFLDMAGFVAATVHRGVRHVRVPTTVLSQNDSGVGVKNGVNAFGVKNFVGSFAPPFAVLNDASFLRTLHPRDRIAGIAEAVKVSLIRDRVFFEWLESPGRAAARVRARGHGAHDPPLRRAAHAPDRPWRGPVRDRQRAPAGLRALVGAQARSAHRA